MKRNEFEVPMEVGRNVCSHRSTWRRGSIKVRRLNRVRSEYLSSVHGPSAEEKAISKDVWLAEGGNGMTIDAYLLSALLKMLCINRALAFLKFQDWVRSDDGEFSKTGEAESRGLGSKRVNEFYKATLIDDQLL